MVGKVDGVALGVEVGDDVVAITALQVPVPLTLSAHSYPSQHLPPILPHESPAHCNLRKE